MGAFDFNSAPEQRDLEVVPDGTVVVLQLRIRNGDAGEGGILTRAKSGACEGLDTELTVIEGGYIKSKLFDWMVVSGTTDGHAQAADITRGKLRAILESARGIKPKDMSEAAKRGRIAEYRDFDGIRFMAKLGVEPGKDGYRDKNVIRQVITPDLGAWHAIEQVEQPLVHAIPATGAKPNDALTIKKPEWAK